MQEEFHKIKRLPPYVFEEVNRLKAQARARGEDIIDFGMGNPDMPTPKHIVDKLVETVNAPRANRYSASRGIPGLRKAQAGYYERRFGVKLDPDTQVIATLGSKEGFANMAQAITAPGDVVLVPNPTYPIHEFGFIISGGVIRHLPASTDSEFMVRLDRAVRHSIPKPIALVLNYPSNPTALVAGLDFYSEVVTYAKRNDLIVLSDIAYAEIYFGDEPPPSILQVPGAMDIAVEFSSLSKTYAMPGWRIGFAVGNERLIGALARVKSYLDYGAYTPVQVAAAAALNGPQECVDEIRTIYRRRRDCLVESLTRAGWEIPSPPATMFAWAPIPESYQALGSLEFSKLLLERAH
ncbi:MAG: LL-diaminopimelate aminotransferase, partial [Alphaproteobacteria bacterium]